MPAPLSDADAAKAVVFEQCPTLAEFKAQRLTFDRAITKVIYARYNSYMWQQRAKRRNPEVVSPETAYLYVRDIVLNRVRAATLSPTTPPGPCTLPPPYSPGPDSSDSSDVTTPSPPSSPLSPACDSHYTHSLPASSSSGSSSLTTPPHCAGCDAWRAMYEQVRQPSNSDDVAGIADKLREADEQSGDLMRAVESLQQRVAWLEQ